MDGSRLTALPTGTEVRTSEVLIVGAGVAGMTAALGSVPRAVTLLTKTELVTSRGGRVPVGGGGSSAWAQGGIAAAVGADDSPRLHATDTLAVAGGLADPEAVAALTQEGPGRVAGLLALGAQFDRRGGDAAAPLALGREAAHSRRRILHACGDATGAELMRVLTEAVVDEPAIRVEDRVFASDLLLDAHGRVAGALALAPGGGWRAYLAPAVVLATGGLGQLYSRTTNPPEVTGDGLAMAARAGARLVDLEMVQFHPTALAAGGLEALPRSLPLVTEALRGEGAHLVDEAGERFMLAEHPLAELAPRDVVARALFERIERGQAVFLDARSEVGERFPERFPTVYAACRAAGVDPRREPIPVTPAAHYHMGGVETDLAGRTSLPGLWACGETACTGVHGANRLASNSLLEGLVFGARVAGDLGRRLAPVPRLEALHTPGRRLPGAGRLPADEVLTRLRHCAWSGIGLVRDGDGLSEAAAELDRLDEAMDRRTVGRDVLETRNLLLAGRMVARAALQRRESRGAHFRSDHPTEDSAWKQRLHWRWLDDDLHEHVTETGRTARARQ